MGKPENIIVVDTFTGRYFINEAYRPIAKALTEKYEELSHISVNNILFIENTNTAKKKSGSAIFAQIGTIPEKWEEIIYQTTGKKFYYMMEIFKVNVFAMSREQIVALIYHELRHIGPDGKLIGHDIEDWSNMVEKLGVNWGTTFASIPDLLDEDIDWDSIDGPTTLFPAETTLKVVK